MDTPHSYIRQILYIQDNSAIASHVKREFGVKVSPRRIAEIRQSQPQRKRA